MESFTYNGKTLAFEEVTGIVLGSEKANETRISSSGGGGFVHNGAGYITPVQIHSTTLTNHEFWIKTSAGKETHVRLENFDIPLRVGQAVTLVKAHSKNGGTAYWALLVNHTAGEYWLITDGERLNRIFRIERLRFWHVLGYAAICGVIWLTGAVIIADGFSLRSWVPHLAWAMGAVWIFAVLRKSWRVGVASAAIDKHLLRLAKEASKAYNAPTSGQP